MFDKRNIRIYYLKTLERIRSFLLSRNSREFLIFLFFVFVSFCFWLLQVLNDDYETEFSIPLRLKNVPSDVVLTSELPDELRIGVKDRGTVLANYMLGTCPTHLISYAFILTHIHAHAIKYLIFFLL